MIDPLLKNKVVLITGANSPHGIGAATAHAFARQGAKIFATYLRQQPETFGMSTEEAQAADTSGEAFYRAQQMLPADQLVQSICDQGGQAEAWEVDLADHEVIPQLFDRVETVFGPVDVLVNNAAHSVADTFIPASVLRPDDRAAGGFGMQPINAESHDQHFAVNSRAVALMMAEFARRHVKRGAQWGRVINVSTDAAAAFASEVSYGASKYALESYSRAAAVELGPWGITVNVVAPGPTQTGYIPPDAQEQLAAATPLRRIGWPDDIADVIVFLASEQARWLTGQLLYVGGGHRMPM